MFETSEAFNFVFNVYLPCLLNFGNEQEAEVMECMSFIGDTIANSLNNFYKECKVVLMGDFNASTYSISNDNKLCAVNSLLDELNLICCDHKNTSGIDYT